MQFGDLDPHLHAQLRVEVGQRLVEQEDLRVAHDGAADRHALALAARKLPGLALEERLELQNFAPRRALCAPLSRRGTPAQPQREAPCCRRRSCADRARRTGTPWRGRAASGGTSLTRTPSITTSPAVISSSPAIMRSSVDLPQPDGPTKTMNSRSFDLEVDALDDFQGAEGLLDVLKFDMGHGESLESLLDGAEGQPADELTLGHEAEDHDRRDRQKRCSRKLGPEQALGAGK